jgi:glycerol uptake facilitator protein
MVAETIGTALLVLVGPGSVVATLILAGDSKPAITGADLLGISFAFGLIIAALVYAIGKVSGCHINPAVTCALAVTKRFPWREVPGYVAAQVAGAVIGAFAIWAVFAHNAIDLGMGMTSFNEDASTWGQAIFSEGIGTFMLMFAILGIVDSRSPSDLAGLVIGGVVVAIIMIVGPITARR